MKLPIRTISPEDAEVFARTIVERTSTKGRVEYLGLQWKSDALLAWEIREREAGHKPKVNVRVDELDLEYVYIDVRDKGVGPFKAISRQPNFTRGLSVFELNRLKKATQVKELDDRLGRLEDSEACQLRIEYYAALGHAADPAARKRLSDYMDRLAQKRLDQAVELLSASNKSPASNLGEAAKADGSSETSPSQESFSDKESEPSVICDESTATKSPNSGNPTIQAPPNYRTLTVPRSHR